MSTPDGLVSFFRREYRNELLHGFGEKRFTERGIAFSASLYGLLEVTGWCHGFSHHSRLELSHGARFMAAALS